MPTVVLGLSTLLVLTLMPLAMVFGYVRFDPKLPEILLWWLPANLLITATAEEASSVQSYSASRIGVVVQAL